MGPLLDGIHSKDALQVRSCPTVDVEIARTQETSSLQKARDVSLRQLMIPLESECSQVHRETCQPALRCRSTTWRPSA